MTGVSDKSKPDKEKGLRGDLSLCHFCHTNIGGVRVWGQMCVWVVGVMGVKPNKSVRHFFTHNGRGCVFVFAVCSFGGDGGASTLRARVAVPFREMARPV